MVRKLCTRALSRCVGSMEYVDSLLIMEDDDDDDNGGDDDDENNASGNHNECSEESAGNGSPTNQHTEPMPDWCK